MSDTWVPDVERWARATDLVVWQVAPQRVWQNGRWFVGGQLNASVACVDRWAEEEPERVAVRWEGEPGDRRAMTYAELLAETRTLARALRGLGVGPGDVVALHLAWLPETVVAMMACARIGAVHAIVPTPLPPEALAARLEELGPKVLFTQDGAWRHGTVIPLKTRVDDALSAVGGIEHTVVVRRTGMDVGWYEGDRWYADVVAGDRGGRRGVRRGGDAGRAGDEPAAVSVDDPLLLISLASRGGHPVKVRLPVGAMVVGSAMLHEWGVADGDTTWCAGDLSWLGAQTHGIYGPLTRGGTIVMYEGTLDVPTHRRAWEVMERHEVTTILTTPSVLRTMWGWSGALDRLPGLDALRRVVVFGEPAEPELRAWAAEHLSPGKRISVADGWGQVELGGIVRLDHPVDPDGIADAGPAILEADGNPVPDGEPGELCLTRGWPGMLRDGTEATEEHWTRLPGVYATGDLARRHTDGSLEFLGRTDQVVSLSGQLVSITEVKAVLLEHPFVRYADVVERRDPRGIAYLAAAVVLDTAVAPDDPALVARDLDRSVRESLGGLARPRMIVLVDRFGDELRGDERRRALATIRLAETPEPKRLTWAQVLAAAESLP